MLRERTVKEEPVTPPDPTDPQDPEEPPVDPEQPPLDPEQPPVDPEQPPQEPEQPPKEPEQPPQEPTPQEHTDPSVKEDLGLIIGLSAGAAILLGIIAMITVIVLKRRIRSTIYKKRQSDNVLTGFAGNRRNILF